MGKHILCLIINSLFCSTLLLAEQQVVPWQDPQVCGINREPACAHFIPFSSEEKALANDLQSNERRMSLDGTWKFLYSRNVDECPKDFLMRNLMYGNGKVSKFPGVGSYKDLMLRFIRM